MDVILPFYECIDTKQVGDLRLDSSFQSPTSGGAAVKFEAWRGVIEGVPVVLLKPLDSNLFRGSAIYGGSYNETQAYLVFSRASLEFMAHAGMQPDIIHAHEWQGSPVPMLFWELFSSRMPAAMASSDDSQHGQQGGVSTGGIRGCRRARRALCIC